jgi:hypothetical protein
MHVLYNGKRLPVDDSTLTENDVDFWQTKKAVVVEDEMELIQTYLVTFSKRHSGLITIDGTECEFVAEKIFAEEPTKDELLQIALNLGLGWNSVIGVETVYQLR